METPSIQSRPNIRSDKTDGPSLRSGFLRHAVERPDAMAADFRRGTLTYGEMDRYARVWAHAIMDLAGGPCERVGVFGYRSPVSYTGTFAAMYSGAAFVPLNPTFPAERTAAMIDLADLDAIVVDRACAAHLEAVLKRVRSSPPLIVPELERPDGFTAAAPCLWKSDIDLIAPLQELPPLVADDLAYLLFTSGSTGAPKGVPVTHGNVRHFIEVMARMYQVVPEDRFSQTADQTFDLCIPELYLPWDCGACVYSMGQNDLLSPAGFVNRHQITVWISVPSVPALMRKRNLLRPGIFPSLRLSLFCGEPLAQASAEAWQAAAPSGILDNLYGPTEVTVACFGHRWDAARSPSLCENGMVAIGRPFPGIGALIVDENLRPAMDGDTGELCVWGPQTTSGYWKDPAKTAERYPMLPVSRSVSQRCYRTGDLVKRLPNGECVFVGRADHQIKVLGHRVETAEVEAVLCRDPNVVHAVAFGWPVKDNIAEGMVAFVSGKHIDAGELRASAKSALPAYMQPSEIFVMEELPLNGNGKVDRERMRAMLAERAAGGR